MQITIDLSTLLAIGSVCTLAGTAALWAFRRVDDVGWIPKLKREVFGDPDETRDARLRLGMVSRVTELESVTGSLARFQRALCIALRIPPTSDEHAIVAAVQRAIAEQSAPRLPAAPPAPAPVTVVVAPDDTARFRGGWHEVVEPDPFPPTPTQLARRPTPYREPIPREEPNERKGRR